MSDLFDAAVRKRLAGIDDRLAHLQKGVLDLQARVGRYADDLEESRAEVQTMIEEEENDGSDG